MILANEIADYRQKQQAAPLSQDDLGKFFQILAPFAPHLAEELWQMMGHQESIFKSAWPAYSPDLVKDDEVNLVVQINGKLRATIAVAYDISEAEAFKLAQATKTVKKWLDDREIVKIIFVPGKLLNIVVKL
jgi:leucyl-tRNA synthetase